MKPAWLRGWDPYLLTLAAIAVVLLVALSVAMPSRFLDPDNFQSMSIQASELGMFSVAMTLAFLAICMAAVWWIFKTGYRLKV